MPIELSISHADRMVVAVVKDRLTFEDAVRYHEELLADGALGYRKIFDLGEGRIDLDNDDLMMLGARFKAYAETVALGAIALVAPDASSYERARLYKVLASGTRPLEIHRSHDAARRWLDSLAVGGEGAT
ncbi:MAG: hypothetical protein KIT25_05935 [Enhydrobacter sp.]|nr:MAG: hypothetical protein KIT25_05935 [Enhydrobacter sp.]